MTGKPTRLVQKGSEPARYAEVNGVWWEVKSVGQDNVELGNTVSDRTVNLAVRKEGMRIVNLHESPFYKEQLKLQELQHGQGEVDAGNLAERNIEIDHPPG